MTKQINSYRPHYCPNTGKLIPDSILRYETLESTHKDIFTGHFKCVFHVDKCPHCGEKHEFITTIDHDKENFDIYTEVL